MEILVGADPEVFVEDKTGRLVCAHDMVEGTKAMPQPVKGGAVQVDGMALEFNIDPARTRQEFVTNIDLVKRELHNMIGVADYNLLSLPHVMFPQEVMDNAHPIALILGCEPDYNAWYEGQVNPPPNGNTLMRTGAGHIHVGWNEGLDVECMDHTYECIDLVKQLDCSLGMQSLVWDKDELRRSMYGKAGAFRVKPYGVEYRVLSNAWLDSEELMAHVYDLTVKSTQDFFSGIFYFEDVEPEDIINDNDVEAAVVASKMLNSKHNLPTLEVMYV